MNPSLTLGTFLRYWRSEWAGLSRAQLALGVDAQYRHGRKHVTQAVVRAWEKGQPPADTEELDALLAVMRRHGLTEPEVSSVRRAVFAACLDRHYPELFAAEEFALQPDVDEQAAQIHAHWPPPPVGSDPVEFIGKFTSVERAVGRDFEPAPAGSQRRRQQVAMAYLRQIMSPYCQTVVRYGLALQHDLRNERFVRDCFPHGGPASTMSAEHMRAAVLFNTALTMETTEPVAGMLSLSRALEARGNDYEAAGIFLSAFALFPAPGVGAARDALWPHVDRHLEAVDHAPGYLALVLPGAAADGRWAQAEAALQGIEGFQHGSQDQQTYWHGKMGEFFFCAGDLIRAEEHFRADLSMSRDLAAVYDLMVLPHLLRACEDARKHPRADRIGLWAEAERAGKAEMRARRRWTGPGVLRPVLPELEAVEA